MSLYGGRPGKTFEIVKVFDSAEEMQAELSSSTIPGSSSSAMDNYWVNAEVPVNSFVLLSTDGTIWIKRWISNKYKYEQVGTVGGIIPEIKDGYWVVGGNETGDRAVAREVEFQVEYDRQLDTYALVRVSVEDELEYGLTNLNQKYILNELGGGTYDPNEDGEYVLVYKSNETGEFIYLGGYREELGYFLVKDLINIQLPEISVFKSNWLQWRFVDEFDEAGNKLWRDLFEITELTNITTYVEEAMRVAQATEDYFYQTEELAKDINSTKEKIEETADLLAGRINEAEGYAQTSIDNYEKTKELIDAILEWEYGETTDATTIPKGAIVYDEKTDEEGNTTYYYKTVKSSSVEVDPLILQEVINARAKFNYLPDRLNNMPYQFDTITDMQMQVNLSRGDKVFTFGRDLIGDGDSSKLFQIFDPNNEEDAARLEEMKPDEDKKVIEEQYPLANGLIAGLLTIFSGYGSGGSGGSAVPSITVTGSEFSVREGEIITLEYYWTGPTAGTATLFITDSNRLTPRVVDYYDSSKVYSSGVAINGFGRGTVTLQPARGEHNYTFYIVDRAQAFSNEVSVKVICGGISMTVNLADGKTFSASDAITYIYTVNTIYSKNSVLEYTIYQNNQVLRQGTQMSQSSSVGAQSIPLQIKSSTENIGQGEFRVQARAYVADDPSTATNYIVRNFVIMETGVIYLTSSYDDDASQEEQNTPFYIPLQLIYVGGSNFQVEGRYSSDENFSWEDGTPLSTILSVDQAGSFTFPITFNEVGTYYLRFKATSTAVTAQGYSRTIKVQVNEAESIYDLQAEDALIVHYSARRGQTNEANRNTWQNISTQTTQYNASLIGFNYSSNGWETQALQTDSGIVNIPTGYLHCSASAYVRSEYPFFSSITQTQGGTFEFVFKSIDIGKEQTILSMTYAQDAGLFVYKDKIVLHIPRWGINNLTAYYNVNGITANDKPVHIAVTIDASRTGYAKIYVNGVLCRATAEVSYNAITSGTTTYVNRALSDTNPQFGIVKVDCMRFYTTVLTPVQILRNYVYNLRDELEQAAIYSKNYLDSDSNDTIPSDIPYMTFYLTKDDWMRMDKDTYKPSIRVTYHDPNPPEGNEKDYEWNGVKTSWQGTSSIAYPVKNFKLKLKDKYTLRGPGKSLPEKTFCLKADYMDSSHCHNTGNANFIHETGLLTNYSLTPAQSKELDITVAQGYKGLNNLPKTNQHGEEIGTVLPDDLKTRTCIYGHPIALYVALETDESAAIPNNESKEYEAPIFWGIYNFNLDKGSNSSFGLQRKDDDFQHVTSFEIAANSAYDGGGFRALRFVKKKNSNNYGWTKWNVGYTNSHSVDVEKGQYLLIYKADSNGTVTQEKRTIEIQYNNKLYVGVYNATRGVKGLTVESERFDVNGNATSSGNYIKLWQLNDETGQLYLEDGEPVLIGLYDYTDGNWSKEVPYDTSSYELKSDWELADDPKDISYKYSYYERDFELRFPDPDLYILPNGDYTKLYYREYDKIIKLVEWVDSVRGDVFEAEFEEHFDKNTLINYYLMLMATGLIDNFGKNLMIDTWGYDKNGNVPYKLNDEGLHKVFRFTGKWNEDEEYYETDAEYEYGLMDVNNPTEEGLYKVYASDKDYSYKGEEIGEFKFNEEDGDRLANWIHEIDESKIVWYTHFYDLDSCLGVNNSGILSFFPSMEMNDQFYVDYNGDIVNNAPFNTSNSALWQQVVTKYNPDIINRFTELRNNGIMDMGTFQRYYYTNIIEQMGPRMYNMDSEPKYLSREPIKVIVNGQVMERLPYSFDHLALGNDWERTKTWLNKRLAYLSSMFSKNSVASGDGFELRIETADKPYHLDIECYDPMYMRIVTKNGESENYRLTNANGIASITIPAAGATDQEIYICPGSNVKKFKEMSNPQLGFSAIILDNASRLLEIDVANSQGLKELTFSSNASTNTNLIRRINVENCPVLTSAISAANYPYLEYINTLGTGSTFTFDDNGGLIQEAYLEGSGDALRIQNYSDLRNLTIQLTYSTAPSTSTLATAHNCKISEISLINCSHQQFAFNIRGRYWQESTNASISSSWQRVPDQNYNEFIRNYGIFSLFPLITNLTIRNSLNNTAMKEQLQPDGSTSYVRELQVSLPLLKRLEVVNTQFDKIALISRTVDIDSVRYQVGYPGWGGIPEVTKSGSTYYFTGDSNYMAERNEGIIGDKNIKELEFRGTYSTSKGENEQLPESGTFEFPWRMYLGTLTGLEKLKFNTTRVTPKKIKSTDDPNYLTKSVSSSLDTLGQWTPARFELILPSAPTDEDDEYKGLKMIYFGQSVTNIDFTCIRQEDTNIGQYIIENNVANITPPYNWPSNAGYFEMIQVGQSDKDLGLVYFHPFRGIDLRGYSNLAMNFNGLTKVKGIVGMNALSLSEIQSSFGANVFNGFFKGCSQLNAFHSATKQSDRIPATDTTAARPDIYTYTSWNFSPWFNQNNGKNFIDISYFFQDCVGLKNTSYLEGLTHWSNTGFEVQKAKGLFKGCSGLESIDINWANLNTTLYEIYEMFEGCTSLRDAHIQIGGIDTSKTHITSLANMFNRCTSLQSAQIVLMTDDGQSFMRYITDMSFLFNGCTSLPSFDFTTTFDSLQLDSQETYVYTFDGLINAESMFAGCTNLQSVKFPPGVNFTSLERFNNGFNGCVALVDVFDMPVSNPPKFYDSSKTAGQLELMSLFAGCSQLKSIKALQLADLRRVTNISSIFSGCSQLGMDVTWERENLSGIENYTLDLSKVKFGEDRSVNMSSAFSGCNNLRIIKLSEINCSNIASCFDGCTSLTTLDVSPIKMKIVSTGLAPANFARTFYRCANLTDAGFTGYEDWDMSQAQNFSAMFSGCQNLTQLDLSKWRAVKNHSSSITANSMFQNCSRLQNIKGLCNLFGEEANVGKEASDEWNRGSFARDGIAGLFNGCYVLALGEQDNYISPWAYVCRTVTSFANMFQDCRLLESLQKVLCNPNTLRADGSIPTTAKLYFGSNWTIGQIGTQQLNCRFTEQNGFDFSNMCANCIALSKFNYFTQSNRVEFATLGRITSLNATTSGCSAMTSFEFTMANMLLHTIAGSTMNSTFAGCTSLTQISLPQRANSNNEATSNQGIKVRINLASIPANPVYWNTLTIGFDKVLYDFKSRGIEPLSTEGKLRLSNAQGSLSQFQPDSDFMKELLALGWDITFND